MKTTIIIIILLTGLIGSCHFGNSPTGSGGTDTTKVDQLQKQWQEKQ